MPFKAAAKERKPTTWKQRQRAYVFAGLRAMGAPTVGCYHLNNIGNFVFKDWVLESLKMNWF